MAFRALRASDVAVLADLIQETRQPHVFLYGEKELLALLDVNGNQQCFVWDEQGIHGAYFMNWEPEGVSIPETTNFCFLDRMFWSSEHHFDFAHRFFLFSAQFEATLRGFDDLILPSLFALGGTQPYLDLGGEEVQFHELSGMQIHSKGIRFHLH